MRHNIKPYIISIAIALGTGVLSALLTRNSMEVYQSINHPPLSPPSQVFPIVWGILFILMGISSAMIYINGRDNNTDSGGALKIYAVQLAFNFLWSIVFFNLRAYLFAFIWLMILWLLIIIMIVKFHKLYPPAAYLQIPYLLWVTFAAYLNLGVFILN